MTTTPHLPPTPYDPQDGPDEPTLPWDDYPWIRAWGRYCNFNEGQIGRIVRRARAENAPSTAIMSWFKGEHWVVLDEITNPEGRRWLMKYAEAFDLEIPQEVMDHWVDPSFDPDQEYGRSPGHGVRS